MKTLSLWAKNNVRSARLLIILSEALLFLMAVRLGLMLLRSGIRLPGIAVVCPLFIAGISALVYYSGKARKRWHNKQYQRRTVCFFLMGLSMFLLTVFFVSSEKILTWNTYSSLSGRQVSLPVTPAMFPANHFSGAGAKKANHLLRKMQDHPPANALYVALIIVATVFLSIGIASLACVLTCNGNGALGLLVLLLGVGGVVFLCVWLCRKLLKGEVIPDPVQRRLEQQEHRRERRLERRKLKRGKDTPENADTTNGQTGKA